ncbi:hypothetical protein GXM_06893 [Nostoc sphaeroides CCNUC1]|uniref:Uncharacterized protein n=1 Tax=Nostoc sphaeroides CCNUC1 TaxID=2653204 RepID=A0A5P8WBV0_9NOSO|nr:hypothetical protein GXM_06893 [Nostoc sphaeroides CCNUC1]
MGTITKYQNQGFRIGKECPLYKKSKIVRLNAHDKSKI